jgi:hypothetical protein
VVGNLVGAYVSPVKVGRGDAVGNDVGNSLGTLVGADVGISDG